MWGDNPVRDFYSNWVPKRPFGGILHTSFSHLVDRLRFVFGELDQIRGSTATLFGEKPVLGAEPPINVWGLDGGAARVIGMEPVDADDAVLMQGTFYGGSLFTVSPSWSLFHASGDRVEAYGSDGRAVRTVVNLAAHRCGAQL